MESSFNKYKAEHKNLTKNAGNKQVVENNLLNSLHKMSVEKWNHLGDLKKKLKDAWELDASVTLKSWVTDFIKTNNLNKKQTEEIAEYFAHESFVNWVYKTNFFGPIESEGENQFVIGHLQLFKWNPIVPERDFLKFAYGLFHSQILRTEKNEIGDFVKSLARQLNFPLGNSWRSNLSRTAYSNNDHDQLKIFDDLKNAYIAYMELLDKKKKEK
jgi:hypothetical protein